MRNVYIALIAFFGIVGFAHGVFAAPPTGGYTPGQTLDPNCAPGDTDCVVTLTPSPWEVSGSNIFYDAGNVGIGTSGPGSANFMVVGDSLFRGRADFEGLSGSSIVLSSGLLGTEGGLYASSGDQQIATYDEFTSFYRYANGALVYDENNNEFTQTGLSKFTRGSATGTYLSAEILETEAGLYSAVGDQQIATYDEILNRYTYANGVLQYNADTGFLGVDGISTFELIAGGNVFFYTEGLGINANTVHPSAVLDISSTTQGLLAPRMTTVQRNAIVSPATGLLVYNTTDNAFNFYNGISWTTFGGGSSLIGSTSQINPGAIFETFLGEEAGSVGDMESAVAVGWRAGKSNTDSGGVFIGGEAGYTPNSGDLFTSTIVGLRAGYESEGDITAFGELAGSGVSMPNGNYGTFVGYAAGSDATNASDSVFIGSGAGSSAASARNSIFIGANAGTADFVDNTTSEYSILIGKNTSTGNFSNSIALGFSAANTDSNQFLIGNSTSSPINTTRINGSAGTQCTITTGTGIACTSDERLKDNIQSIEDGILEKIQGLDAVTYTWSQDENSTTQIGFLAQQLETIFPELVATDSEGYKSVFYSQMVPILTKGIQEIYGLMEGIFENLETQRVQTEELCVGSTCITEEQFLEVFGSTGQSASFGQSGQDQNEVVEDIQNSENQQIAPEESGEVLEESQNQENNPEITLTETESSQEEAEIQLMEETTQEGDMQNIEPSNIE